MKIRGKKMQARKKVAGSRSKSRLAKAAPAEPSGGMSIETFSGGCSVVSGTLLEVEMVEKKCNAAMKIGFRSQTGIRLLSLEHLWKASCLKHARIGGAKPMWKSRCQKQLNSIQGCAQKGG